MWFFRLKWTVYHFLSCILAVLACALLLHLLFPDLIALPTQPEIIAAALGIAVVVCAIGAVVGAFYSGREVRSELEEITLGAKTLPTAIWTTAWPTAAALNLMELFKPSMKWPAASRRKWKPCRNWPRKTNS